ncbi:hypothetical protein OHT76_19520 [Streptomyces sp. NBC_00287]|uniref:hypothetical protein n=1 Tax=Streptomyces sp. NBC_00287 TaxID=2975702 RepID=UPI002E29B15D|nr:hypothetical protein [Streptomyces sp. NBC_00287]
MTQSGQGEEPSARPAREGIVLPSDGGEPLLPGMTGGYGSPQQPAHPTAPPTPAAPPGGQAWNGSWGPEQPQPPTAPPPGQGWTPPPAQPWAGPEHPPAPWPTPDEAPAPSQPLPPEGAPAPAPSYGDPTGYGTQLPPADAYGSYADQGTPLPPAGPSASGALPPGPAYGDAGQGAQLPPAGPSASGALPPGPAYGDAGQGVQLSPAGPSASGALPPGPAYGDDGATQYIPPVVDDGATRYIPPVREDGATQYIPPVGAGALPPEVGTPETPAESTQVLGRVRRHAAPNPDAEATQYIAPVPASAGGERQTPAEFDNLFRSEPGGEPPAASTQQMPRFQQPQPQRYGAQQQPPLIPRREAHDDEGRRGGGRTGSRVTLFAAVGVGIAVVGIGAGALLASGGGDDDSDNKTVAATAPASESASPSPSADPVEQQAVELDKLLADSGNSRTMVINAVADVKACTNLPQAAKDLRDAAKQRNDLVTKLATLSVDKLPQHTELTTALNKAWQASASADNHYAAWADQVAQRKGQLCKKGQARATPQTQAGNTASGTASTEKAKAAGLWNSIAKTYGLTERQPTQL